MSRLRNAPTGEIRTLRELLTVAQAMGLEAAGRYGDLAGMMRTGGNDVVAEVFALLEADERARAHEVEQKSATGPTTTQDRADMAWTGWSEVFDPEDLASSSLVTPYTALSVAVRNEERVFAFWSYVSAHATAPDVRREAERMALEALSHVGRLRKARRGAFHRERAGRRRDARPEDFPRRAKLRLLNLSRALSGTADRLEDEATAATFRAVAAEQRAEADRIRLGTDAAQPFAEETAEEGASAAAMRSQDDLDRAVSLVEEALDQCFEAAERSRDERVVALAQHLAQRGVQWIARLRGLEG